MNETFLCDVCQQEHPVSHMHEFDGKQLCENCLIDKTVICENCDTRIWRRDADISPQFVLCGSCRTRFVCCDRCGRVIHEDTAYYTDDSDDPLCFQCFEARTRERSIHDYYYKPAPVFFGEGDRFFGVELEIDGPGSGTTMPERFWRSAIVILNTLTASTMVLLTMALRSSPIP